MFTPPTGEVVYYTPGAGPLIWTDNYLDWENLATGEVYLTREAARFALKRKKVIAELYKLAQPFVPNWDDPNQSRCTIGYSHGKKKFAAYYVKSTQHTFGLPVFSSIYEAERAIAVLGDKLNYLLGE